MLHPRRGLELTLNYKKENAVKKTRYVVPDRPAYLCRNHGWSIMAGVPMPMLVVDRKFQNYVLSIVAVMLPVTLLKKAGPDGKT